MKKFFLILFTAIILVASALPSLTLAAVDDGIIRRPLDLSSGCLYDGPEVTKQEGRVVTLDCVPIVFFNVVFWLLLLAGTTALFFVILGGIKFITSGGDPKQTEGARKTITWAIIGLVLILLSFGIVRFISDVVGMECLREFGFTACKAS